jgi:hypothetical protein
VSCAAPLLVSMASVAAAPPAESEECKSSGDSPTSVLEVTEDALHHLEGRLRLHEVVALPLSHLKAKPGQVQVGQLGAVIDEKWEVLLKGKIVSSRALRVRIIPIQLTRGESHVSFLTFHSRFASQLATGLVPRGGGNGDQVTIAVRQTESPCRQVLTILSADRAAAVRSGNDKCEMAVLVVGSRGFVRSGVEYVVQNGRALCELCPPKIDLEPATECAWKEGLPVRMQAMGGEGGEQEKSLGEETAEGGQQPAEKRKQWHQGMRRPAKVEKPLRRLEERVMWHWGFTKGW